MRIKFNGFNYFLVNFMLYKSNHFLKKFSISDAAIAYQKPRSVIMKYIKRGQLQLDYYKLIDYHQLIQVFGELSTPIKDEKEDEIYKLRNEIQQLKNELNIISKPKSVESSEYLIQE